MVSAWSDRWSQVALIFEPRVRTGCSLLPEASAQFLEQLRVGRQRLAQWDRHRFPFGREAAAGAVGPHTVAILG
jgi:hypothetical protein